MRAVGSGGGARSRLRRGGFGQGVGGDVRRGTAHVATRRMQGGGERWGRSPDTAYAGRRMQGWGSQRKRTGARARRTSIGGK
ncbi:hypothetical protein ARHIZOSPH14_19370 [Agromyces rhizosphaerae]|uniref:Uncharacterized protein n=1 Tax=Agromyces rhizosphaerae TaxID=88374 RepID=A0A9W6CXX8_9MICO|nr:hypothetical protein ARHIZOSPH14_19370 [Agromyces rhizosphaerae]